MLLLDLKPNGLGGSFPRSFPGFARLGLLSRHSGIEPAGVDANAARPKRILCEVEGEPIGIVQLEGGFTGERCAGYQLGGRFAQQPKPARQGGAEPCLLQFQRFGDHSFGAHKLFIVLAHFPNQRRHQPPEQRVFGA